MSKKPEISFFFPAYNEENQIGETLQKAEEVAKKYTAEYELIVVDDGSNDNTGQIVRNAARRNPRVRLIQHARNQGYGGAVWSGIQACRLEYIFLADSDLQFNLEEISKLIPHTEHSDIVIGYRRNRRDNFMRIINAKGWNILNRIFFGLKVKDIDCAFKLMRRTAVAELPVISRGAMISAEILIRLNRKGFIFEEVPVTHYPNRKMETTGAKPRVIVRALHEMHTLWRGDLGGGKLPEIIKFGLVGISNTILDLGIFSILTKTTGFFAFHAVSAKTISFIFGSTWSYVANRTFTFPQKEKPNSSEIVKFYLTALGGLVINAASAALFFEIIGKNVLAAAAASIVSFAWNFFITKFWVFQKADRKVLPTSIRKIPEKEGIL